MDAKSVLRWTLPVAISIDRSMCINKDINVLSVFHIQVSFLIQLQRGILFMYSAFEDLHASSKCRHNYSVSCWPFSARASPLLYPASSLTVLSNFPVKVVSCTINLLYVMKIHVWCYTYMYYKDGTLLVGIRSTCTNYTQERIMYGNDGKRAEEGRSAKHPRT